MSRKTRTPRRRSTMVVHRPQGTALTPAQRSFLRRCRTLPHLTDPLEVELTVSTAVSDITADEQFWFGVITHAATSPRGNGRLLRHLAAMLTGRPREWAATAAPPAGPPLAVVESWICDRSLDAGYLALLCTYRFTEDHAMVFLIDELTGGVVRKAFVTKNIPVARARLAEQGTLHQISPEAAHWLLAKSFHRLDRNPGLEVDDDVHRTRLLSGRRIALAFG